MSCQSKQFCRALLQNQSVLFNGYKKEIVSETLLYVIVRKRGDVALSFTSFLVFINGRKLWFSIAIS